MADAVTARKIREDNEFIVYHLTNISDGTGESAVAKVDKSAINVASDGAEPDSLDIQSVRWNIQGFTSVRILWDHTTDDVALTLSGSGYDVFGPTDVGDTAQRAGLKDPRSSGQTGDILLTTSGGASGSTYDITLVLRKNPV